MDIDILREAVRVPMRDGTEISVHIYRPAAGPPVPALLSYTPYRKGALGAPPPYVSAGYAAVFFDIRGTGDSSGWNDSIYSDAERQDGYDMVEWVAAQPWCSGKIGMYGISYGAVVAIQMAQAAPPHLKAIIARSGSDDPYTEWTNPGGQPRTYMYECYSTIMPAFNASPPDPAAVGKAWEAIWADRLENNRPWGLSFLENILDGPFWRARSLRGHYGDVRCAVYVVDGWADWYSTPLLRIFAELAVPKRALIGPWSHQFPDVALPGPRIDWNREMLRWFDYWLKGIDTGIMEEPPLLLFVRDYQRPAPLFIEDAGSFCAEREWPPARRVERPFYLCGDRLTGTPGTETAMLTADPRAGVATGKHGGGPFNDNWMLPLDQRADTPYALVYTADALAEDQVVIGRPRAMLRFTCDSESALFAVKLCDVAPDGTVALITKGFLNASHRHSHTTPEPLTPGVEYEVEVELLACAYRVAAGHRLRVMIAGADFLNVWPLPYNATVMLRGSSCLWVPVILTPSDAPIPDLGVSPHPLPARETLQAPSVSVTRDLVSGQQTLQYRAQYGSHFTHSARYTVNPADPAQVVLQADAQHRMTCQGREMVISTQADTTSDAHHFRHTLDLRVTMNDQPHFHKQWETTVERRLM